MARTSGGSMYASSSSRLATGRVTKTQMKVGVGGCTQERTLTSTSSPDLQVNKRSKVNRNRNCLFEVSEEEIVQIIFVESTVTMNLTMKTLLFWNLL